MLGLHLTNKLKTLGCKTRAKYAYVKTALAYIMISS